MVPPSQNAIALEKSIFQLLAKMKGKAKGSDDLICAIG
jgi:hypothetical protein